MSETVWPFTLQAPLPLSGGWELEPAAQDILVETLLRVKPKAVLDLGSGLSSILSGSVLRYLGSGRVISIEHDSDYLANTRQAIHEHGLEDWVRLVHCPLIPLTLPDWSGRYYDLSALEETGVLKNVDCVIIDGPPGNTNPLARYPFWSQIGTRLAPGTVMLLDDGRRGDEQTIIRRWQADYPSLSIQFRETPKGLFEITLPNKLQ
jgi:predicted O-methyltransferase YrrM